VDREAPQTPSGLKVVDPKVGGELSCRGKEASQTTWIIMLYIELRKVEGTLKQ